VPERTDDEREREVMGVVEDFEIVPADVIQRQHAHTEDRADEQ
jgi:hypothetical protein